MQDSSHNPASPDITRSRPESRASTLLVVGFVACISLFAVLMAYGLHQTQESQHTVRELVVNYNAKSELVVRMYNAARERSLMLYAMVTTDDVFEYDELFVKLNSEGAKFAVARLDLLDMNLATREQELLAEQADKTRIAVPLQLEVIDLLYDDKRDEATSLLTGKAIPAQNKVLETLRMLQEYQRVNAAETTLQTEQAQFRIVRLMMILGGLTIALCIAIAIYVIRRAGAAEHELNLEKELAELTLRSIGDAVITTDLEGRVVMMNPNAEKLTGWSAAAVMGRHLNSIFQVVDEANRHQLINPIDDVLSTGTIIQSTETEILIDRHGKEYGIEHSVAPITELDGRILGTIIIFRDVTENRALANQLSHQATHDTLTGLVNRREFELRLEHAFVNVRADNTAYALCFMDLDQFKLINDTCGHNAGDELLRQVAAILKKHVRRTDTLARLGGDEFGLLLEACSLSKAEEIARILLKAVVDFRFSWKGQSFDVGISIGVAPITPLTGNISELLSAADTACYIAKDKGRNQIHVYHPDDSELAQHRGEVQWVQRINEALESNNFILYYQPIISLNEARPAANHYEILLRMMNDIGDLVPPMAFIPAAERYKLMPSIDKWVVHNALLEIQHTCDKIDWHTDDYVFTINISGQSLSATDFAEYILEEIRQRDISPEQLCFEITETAAIANMSSAIDFITILKAAGCKFALDDFGSGLSSFSYLKNMPVDYLKIDGSFVRDVCDDRTDHAFIESITQIAHVMNIRTVAEFVEDRQVLRELRNIGVDYAQGYYIATPIPLSLFEATESKRAIS